MKLSVKGLAITLGLVWGVLGMLLVGLCNLIWPSYGVAFLEVMASLYPGYPLYPGYHATASFGQVIVGTMYGVVDGAVAGAVFAWVYNRFAGA
jgi:hypothetical protein